MKRKYSFAAIGLCMIACVFLGMLVLMTYSATADVGDEKRGSLCNGLDLGPKQDYPGSAGPFHDCGGAPEGC